MYITFINVAQPRLLVNSRKCVCCIDRGRSAVVQKRKGLVDEREREAEKRCRQ